MINGKKKIKIKTEFNFQFLGFTNMMGSVDTSASAPLRPLEEVYQKKTQLEHILLRPDTYIGSVEKTPQHLWILEEMSCMKFKAISIIPGLYKIFDEILVNAADNKVNESFFISR